MNTSVSVRNLDKKNIGNIVLLIGMIILIMLNWNEYSLYQHMVKYNAFFYGIVLISVFVCYIEKPVWESIKSDKLLIFVMIIDILAIVLLLIGGRGTRVFIDLFDLTLTLYLSTKLDFSKSKKVLPIMFCVFFAIFFVYWTIDVKGYFKGYSINYGGLVLISGFVFFILLCEWIKKHVITSESDNAVILFLKINRFYFLLIEVIVFVWGYKIISWYRSRTALFAMIVFGILIVVPREILNKKYVYYAVSIGAIALGNIFPFLYTHVGNHVDQNVYTLFYKPLFSSRMVIWPQLIELCKAFPITGIGTLYMNGTEPYRDGLLDTCSSFMNLYVVYGVVVASLVNVLLIIVLIRLYENVSSCTLSKVAFAGLIAFIVASYAESFITTVPFVGVFFVLLSVTKYLAVAENDDEYDSEFVYYQKIMKEKLGKRFVRCFVPLFSLAFMYCIFGPIEIFYANVDEYLFNLKTFSLILVPLAMLIPAIVALVIASMPDIISRIVCAIATGLTIASYIQYLFFNEDLVDEFGIFSDARNIGAKYYVSMIVFFGICMISAVIVLELKERNVVSLLVCGGITVVQLVALVSILIPLVIMPTKTQYIRIFDTDSEFEVATDENIIVIMLDTFGRNYLEDIEKEWPEKTEFLHDFTYYDNADSKYAPTFPSVVHMLTDTEYDESMKRREYERNAYESQNSKQLFGKLHDNGYSCMMYTTDMIMDEYLDDIYDNVKVVQKTDNIKAILSVLMKQSVYRYVPYCIKPCFEWTLDEAKYTYSYESAPQYYTNYKAYNRLNDSGVVVNEELAKKFEYLHFEGAHSYPNNDENCNEVPMSSVPDYVGGAGSLVMVEKYLDELKELGKYDSASIVILGDHGNSEHAYEPIMFVKKRFEEHDEYQANHDYYSYCDFEKLIEQLIL